MNTVDVRHDEREADGLWFLTTFLAFGYGLADERNPLKPDSVTYVPTDDAGGGFSQVIVELESGETWRVEVERVEP